jgi:phosphoglycerate kinase
MTRPSSARPLGVPGLDALPELKGKAVLVRATLDLPLGQDLGSPMAALRARNLEATLRWLAETAGKVTVFGDLSGPGSEPDANQAERVRQITQDSVAGVTLSVPFPSADDGGVIEDLVASHDVFVNDSFQWSYLPLPSLMVPAGRMPSAVGRGMQHDLEIAARLLNAPERPFVAVLGGRNSFLRLHGLRGLLLRADAVLVGGSLSLPLLQSTGRWHPDGTPGDFLAECRATMGLAQRVHHQIHLPLDLAIHQSDDSVDLVQCDNHVKGEVVDIGPLTARRFSEIVEGAGTVLWTGALGLVEDPRFAAGTLTVAGDFLSDRPRHAVIGGDALASVLASNGHLERSIAVVTATDPLLELLKNGDLPALAALRASH